VLCKQKAARTAPGGCLSWWERRAVFGGLPAAVGLVQFVVPMSYLLFKVGALR
jgi:hypothetical protein